MLSKQSHLRVQRDMVTYNVGIFGMLQDVVCSGIATAPGEWFNENALAECNRTATAVRAESL